MSKVHSPHITRTHRTRCGIEKDGVLMTSEVMAVTCKRCLLNIKYREEYWEKKMVERDNA